MQVRSYSRPDGWAVVEVSNSGPVIPRYEVPGLFEGNDFAALMQECKEQARRDGLSMETEDELFKHFTQQVQANLHVVFTMNPANEDFDNR